MKDYRQTVHIKADPEEVFNAITNPLTIELWSGYPAQIQPVADTEFALFDGDITGRNILVEHPSLLEQEWYFGDQEETSIVRLEISWENGKTRILLSHTNIPDEAFENIAQGWKEYYLGALKSYLED
jgi:uncharacterized protein YndB with AHSA1/START domain